MPSESAPTRGHRSTTRAVRHHLVVVIVFLALGTLGGVAYAASLPTTFTSTARVLVNPTAGNPFVPTPTAVRQDQATSLETEAQVARSAEVLSAVATAHPPLTTPTLQGNLQVTVPPNTQVLEISYTAGDATTAQTLADAVARAYLANRARRFDEVTAAGVSRVATQTERVVTDLRAATAAAQKGSDAERLFQSQLATALRNELVSLRAQRSALESAQSPAGAVISPASRAESAVGLVAIGAEVGLALAGLVLGCLLALLLERSTGVVRSPREVEELGLPVAAAVPAPRWRRRWSRADGAAAFDTTIRRLRASILELGKRPDVIAVAPAGSGASDAEMSEAVAESFAKAGHRVVLVRTDDSADGARGLVVEDGLAQALLYERLDVLALLQPTVEPLLCVLPSGAATAESRELFVADRLRAVLVPLVEAGNLVVVQSPGLDSTEGEAIVAAAQLGLVVVTARRTRSAAVEQVVQGVGASSVGLAALVVGRGDAARRTRLATGDDLDGSGPERSPRTRSVRRLSRSHR